MVAITNQKGLLCPKTNKVDITNYLPGGSTIYLSSELDSLKEKVKEDDVRDFIPGGWGNTWEEIPEGTNVVVIGGKYLYEKFLGYADEIYHFVVDEESGCEKSFPELGDGWQAIKFRDNDDNGTEYYKLVPRSRPSFHQVFLDLAEKIAERSTCSRKHVGCVIAKDNEVVSMGYNGSVSGLPHCDEVGHKMEDGHCLRTIHAEQNALLQARPKELEGASAYITCSPCIHCLKMIANAGIKEIHFREKYKFEDTKWLLEKTDIQVYHHADPEGFSQEVTVI